MENGLNIHSEGSIIVPRLHDLEIIENIQLTFRDFKQRNENSGWENQ